MCSGRGGDVVALVVGVLEERCGGGPVGLSDQAGVELAGERSPALGRGLGDCGLESSADLAAVGELLGSDGAGVGDPVLDGVAQVAAGLHRGEAESGADPGRAGVPCCGGPGGDDLGCGDPGGLGREVVETLGEEQVAERGRGIEGGPQRVGASAG